MCLELNHTVSTVFFLYKYVFLSSVFPSLFYQLLIFLSTPVYPQSRVVHIKCPLSSPCISGIRLVIVCYYKSMKKQQRYTVSELA